METLNVLLREGYKVRKIKILWIFPHLGGAGLDRGHFSTLFLKCVEWSNSSRNAKKFFSVLGGVGGTPQPSTKKDL